MHELYQFLIYTLQLILFFLLPLILGAKRKSSSPALAYSSKRKKVSFGVNLSPELFDRRLPSGTPLRKGSAPRASLGTFLILCDKKLKMS